MRAHELARQLLKLPDLPVVVPQEDEPMGDYSCTGAELAEAMRGSDKWREVWESGDRGDREQVVMLTVDEAPAIVVDAEVIEPHEQRDIACPSCGYPLTVSARMLPGDSVACPRCQQIHVLPPPLDLNVGAGWRELAAAEPPVDPDFKCIGCGLARTVDTAEGWRCLNCGASDVAAAEQPPAEVTRPSVGALGAGTYHYVEQFPIPGRCFLCNEPAYGLACAKCSAMLDRIPKWPAGEFAALEAAARQRFLEDPDV